MVRKYEKRPLESYLLTVLTGGYLGGFYKCSSGRGILNAPASKLSFAQGRQSTLRMHVQRDIKTMYDCALNTCEAYRRLNLAICEALTGLAQGVVIAVGFSRVHDESV